MTPFQIVTVPFALFLFGRSVFRLVRGYQPRSVALLGAAIWLSAALTILRPELTIRIARIMGIGRGADLVLYILALCFFLSVFYFYHRVVKLESNLSEIVRRLAISDAIPGGPQSPLETKLEHKQADNGSASGNSRKEP